MLSILLALAVPATCGIFVGGSDALDEAIARLAAERTCEHSKDRPSGVSSITVFREDREIKYGVAGFLMRHLQGNPSKVATLTASLLASLHKPGAPWTIEITTAERGDVSIRTKLAYPSTSDVVVERWDHETMKEPLRTRHKPSGEQIQEP